MKILVIGAGAVGIGLATSIASQNASVSIYARGKTAKTIRKNGIKRTGLFEHIEIENIPVYMDYDEIPKTISTTYSSPQRQQQTRTYPTTLTLTRTY